MAGRVALARQGTGDARTYFSELVVKTNAPSDLINQGYFAWATPFFNNFKQPTNGTIWMKPSKR